MTEKIAEGAAQENLPPLMQNKGYLYLTAAQLLSALGDGVALIALFSLFGFAMDATPMEMAFLVLALGAPTVIFGPLTGVMADRMDRKTLMIVSDLARAALVFALTFSSDKQVLYALLVSKGFFEAIFTPAKTGMLKEVVPTGQMDQVVGISTVIDYGSKIVGPAIGGVLIAAFGIKIAFYIDAASFLLSGLLLLMLAQSMRSYRQERKEEEAQESFKQQFFGGLQFMRQQPFLLYGAFAFSLAMLIITLSDAQLSILFRTLPDGKNMTLYGVVMGAVGLGTLLVAGALSQRNLERAIGLMALGTLGVGGAFGAITWCVQQQLAHPWIWFPLLGLIGGGFAGAVIVPFQTVAQKRTPENYTSRVFGVIGSLSTFATIAGPLTGGIIATWIGVIPMFTLASLLLIVTGVLLLGFKPLMEPAGASPQS